MAKLSTSASDTGSLSHQIVRDVGGFIAEKGLISPGDRVLCMVSGGADSVTLLTVLERLSREEETAFAGSFSLGVCHVNYGLRGEASDGDEAHVCHLGDKLGVTVHSVRAPRHDGSNFQAWARDFRYLAAQNLSRSHDYTRIAVGHNKDDRVETLIYRLVTYSGRRSLVVMPPRRGRVVRPLLQLDAREIRDYCRREGIIFRDDASNSSLDYARNRIRQQVLPRLAEIRPDFRDRILDTLSLLEDEDAVLDTVTESVWRQIAVSEDGHTVLLAGELAAQPRAIARLLVRRWLAGADSEVRLSRRKLDSVIDICREQSGSRELSLSEGLRVERKYDRLSLAVGEARAQTPGLEPVSLPVPGKTAFGDYEIESVEAPWWGVASPDPWMATIDATGLKGELQVRPWRAGDRFTPLGLKGNKSLQDLFVDAKIPRSERARIPVVVRGEEIVWVCGLRIAEDFRVTSRSERLVGLKATRRIVDNTVW